MFWHVLFFEFIQNYFLYIHMALCFDTSLYIYITTLLKRCQYLKVMVRKNVQTLGINQEMWLLTEYWLYELLTSFHFALYFFKNKYNGVLFFNCFSRLCLEYVIKFTLPLSCLFKSFNIFIIITTLITLL